MGNTEFEFQYCGKYRNNAFATQNRTRQDGLFQAIEINNEGINAKLKRVTKTSLRLGATKLKCNYIILRIRQK